MGKMDLPAESGELSHRCDAPGDFKRQSFKRCVAASGYRFYFRARSEYLGGDQLQEDDLNPQYILNDTLVRIDIVTKDPTLYYVIAPPVNVILSGSEGSRRHPIEMPA